MIKTDYESLNAYVSCFT